MLDRFFGLVLLVVSVLFEWAALFGAYELELPSRYYVRVAAYQTPVVRWALLFVIVVGFLMLTSRRKTSKKG